MTQIQYDSFIVNYVNEADYMIKLKSIAHMINGLMSTD